MIRLFGSFDPWSLFIRIFLPWYRCCIYSQDRFKVFFVICARSRSRRFDGKITCRVSRGTNALQIHARYLPRRAVVRRANCSGKIAPSRRRQLQAKCVHACVCTYMHWYMCNVSPAAMKRRVPEEEATRTAELPGNSNVCEISRMYSIHPTRAEQFRRTRARGHGGANINTSEYTK